MSESPIIILPADPSTGQNRRGIALGMAAFALSVFTAFWAIILWAVSLSVASAGSARGVAIAFFVGCAIVGFLFFALTAIVAVLALRRNVRLGQIYAAVGSAIALGSLVLGIVLASSIS